MSSANRSMTVTVFSSTATSALLAPQSVPHTVCDDSRTGTLTKVRSSSR